MSTNRIGSGNGLFQQLLQVAKVGTQVAAQVTPQPAARQMLNLASSGFEVAQRALVNLGGNTPQQPSNWTVRVTPFEGHPGFLRAGPSANASQQAQLPVGTELEVLQVQGQWYQVRTPDGQTGWLVGSRTEHVRGTARGAPYVHADGRDGSRTTGLAHATHMIGGGEGYVDEQKKVTYCLGFVNDCYYLSGVPLRCEEMSNPGKFGYAGTANGAFLALQDNGKIRTSQPTDRLEPGAIVFFAPTTANGMAGHVCIATGEMAPPPDNSPMLITSGFLNSPKVKRMSLLEMQRESGAYLGYTTPEIAFTPGTYGGGSAQ
jgi:hypothetical protein